MGGFFYQLGKQAGPLFRQGRWVLQSLTGSPEEALAAERAVGRDIAAEFLGQLPPPALEVDAARSAWIQALTERLQARLTNRHRRFTVRLVATGAPNAFALPGGFVFVEPSLLDLCGDDPDETAFVLGHEFGHVVEGHAIQRLVTDRVFGRAVARLPVGGLPGMVLRQAAGLFLTSAYSRDQEFAADRFGAKLAGAAGFDPRGGARLLGRLARFHDDRPQVPLLDYFATHPSLAERIAVLDRSVRPAPGLAGGGPHER